MADGHCCVIQTPYLVGVSYSSSRSTSVIVLCKYLSIYPTYCSCSSLLGIYIHTNRTIESIIYTNLYLLKKATNTRMLLCLMDQNSLIYQLNTCLLFPFPCLLVWFSRARKRAILMLLVSVTSKYVAFGMMKSHPSLFFISVRCFFPFYNVATACTLKYFE